MPLPRILYAMGKDGVIFRFLARINSRFQTPMFATIISGSLAGIVSFSCIKFPLRQRGVVSRYYSGFDHDFQPGNAD